MLKLPGFKLASVYKAVKCIKKTEALRNVVENVVQAPCLLWKRLRRSAAKFNKIRSDRCAKWLAKLVISECSVPKIELQDPCVQLSKQKGKEERISKSRQMIHLIAGARLSKKLSCREEFAVEPLHYRQCRRQILKKSQQKFTVAKNHQPQSFSEVREAVDRLVLLGIRR
ncbi:hypothetical protein KIN20_004286 [Parelaphostrongylus tenuis]|uniref:Uncharacterized protein n=1 Tax=Parelaphostrongylus tenuis TaxID=148309 RepID=A0AAD5LYK5_PARTN|nr:hypothetical protein KIN20_004286 [Parelaphostrongylus tenuis]